MLTKVKLHNFKSHKDTELILDNSRLHALVGQNSSGKTSVLQALYCLSRLAETSFVNIFKHEIAPQFITTREQDNMFVSASGFWGDKGCQNWEASYKFHQQNTNPRWFPIASWKFDQEEKDILEGWKSSFYDKAPDPITLSLRYSVYLPKARNY